MRKLYKATVETTVYFTSESEGDLDSEAVEYAAEALKDNGESPSTSVYVHEVETADDVDEEWEGCLAYGDHDGDFEINEYVDNLTERSGEVA